MIYKTFKVTAVALFIVTVGYFFTHSTTHSPENTTVRLSESFNQESVDKVLNALDAAEKVVTEGETFTLIITSPGGSSNALATLIDRLLSTELKVITKVHTYAFSAGAISFVLGDERVMEKNSSLLFHGARFIINGLHITKPVLDKYLSGEKDLLSDEMLKMLEREAIENLIEARQVLIDLMEKDRVLLESIFPKEVVDKLLVEGKDVVISAEEALEMGVATSIYEFKTKKASK